MEISIFSSKKLASKKLLGIINHIETLFYRGRASSLDYAIALSLRSALQDQRVIESLSILYEVEKYFGEEDFYRRRVYIHNPTTIVNIESREKYHLLSIGVSPVGSRIEMVPYPETLQNTLILNLEKVNNEIVPSKEPYTYKATRIIDL